MTVPNGFTWMKKKSPGSLLIGPSITAALITRQTNGAWSLRESHKIKQLLLLLSVEANTLKNESLE